MLEFSKITRKKLFLLVGIMFMSSFFASAQEIPFDESFVLSETRLDTLKQLLPASDDYYFYHCLYYEQQGDKKQFDIILKQWIARYPLSSKLELIKNRQALLEQGLTPSSLSDFIKDKLNLKFLHQVIPEKTDPTIPSVLNQNLISKERFTANALRLKDDLSGFTLRGLYNIEPSALTPLKRRELLKRLTKPDYPDLPNLVVEDLKYQRSGGFGSHSIHHELTLEQLDACLLRLPQLINVNSFFETYISKLHPSRFSNWENSLELKDKYLKNLWDFVQGLPPAQNSLKAHVLYHLLDNARKKGEYDRKLFYEYIKLPKLTNYVNQNYLRSAQERNLVANLAFNFTTITLMPSVNNDEPLIRDYLETFLIQQDSYSNYLEYLDHEYLRQVFAQIKLMRGTEDMESIYSMLATGEITKIGSKIELDFLPSNPTYFSLEDPVKLDLEIKNIQKLIVRIFYINTENYYKSTSEPIDYSIDLDGLVPNEELTFTYDYPQIIRHRETFDFPQLTKQGAYVIEFIGNGKSSRALIQKSTLYQNNRISVAGHIFNVYNEKKQLLNKASIWFKGREFVSDENGEILVPFTNEPGVEQILLVHDGFACQSFFEHLKEEYRLDAGFFIDREQIIDKNVAKFAVSPRLYLNDTLVDVGILENLLLKITLTDADGIATTVEKRNVSLDKRLEYIDEIRIPEKLVEINFQLTADIENISQGKQNKLRSSESISVNTNQESSRIENLYIKKSDNKYYVFLLGRTGEAIADYPLTLQVKHKDFVRSDSFLLKTDSEGKLTLGELKDIQTISIQTDSGAKLNYSFEEFKKTYPSVLNLPYGKQLLFPINNWDASLSVEKLVTVLRKGRGTYIEDSTKKAKVLPGFIDLTELPIGEYELFLKEEEKAVEINIVDGIRALNTITTENGIYQTRLYMPLQVKSITEVGKQLKICLDNFTPVTRLHLVAGKFLPPFTMFDYLKVPLQPEFAYSAIHKPLSAYTSARTIGEEYRYILERRHHKNYYGNMLNRPSLLLNPWSLRKTDTSVQRAKDGEAFAPSPSPRAPYFKGKTMSESSGSYYRSEFADSTLDFLSSPSVSLYNLLPDQDGVVSIDLKLLQNNNCISVFAVNYQEAVQLIHCLKEKKEPFKDLSMKTSFEHDKHYTQQKNISLFHSNSNFAIDDISTGEIEVYDSLNSVYKLLLTLNPDSNLTNFAFITDWANLSDIEKKSHYSKYSSHELNFFIYQKDKEFFKAVVMPYINNKYNKTFLDNWLLNENLEQYLALWEFNRLNIVEKILLSKRLATHKKPIVDHVKELYELEKFDLITFNKLFDTAIKASAAESQDRFGFFEASAEAVKAKQAIPTLRRARALHPSEMPSSLFAEAEAYFADKASGDISFTDEDFSLRDASRREKKHVPFYRALDKTEEWVENNYYNLPIEKQVAELVKANPFWNDYALSSPDVPFISKNIIYASSNFTEMMFALSVLDLAFTPQEPKATYQGTSMKMELYSNSIIFHKEIKSANYSEKGQTILVSQNLFDNKNRYKYENNEKIDLFVTDEFLVSNVYGSQVTVTNPTSNTRQVDLLLQIPTAALPVKNGFFTKSIHLELEPFSTKNFEYFFYFPVQGLCFHYPVQVAENSLVIAAGKPSVLKVVEEPTDIDMTSWNYVSQRCSDAEVLDYLKTANVQKLDLSLVLFRLKTQKFYKALTELLSERFIYNHDVWSYSIYHSDPLRIPDYLANSPLVERVGSLFESPLLTIDPVKRHKYQHKEYSPLVNARSHFLGEKRAILNKQFAEHYTALLGNLKYKAALSDKDKLSLSYYLILQDRVLEASDLFEKISDKKTVSLIQYDYMNCWLLFAKGENLTAYKIAEKYKNYPIDRWRYLFEDIISQHNEICGLKYSSSDSSDRTQTQTVFADMTPAISARVDNQMICIDYKNISSCHLNFYLMDLELLFSHNPFVQDVTERFTKIIPNYSTQLDLDESGKMKIEVPAEISDKNTMIEVRAEGIHANVAYYPHSLVIHLMEAFGHLQVISASNDKFVPGAYVKVYARMKNGEIHFYKDGYTDMRGRFDYVSLNTDELDRVERFAILVVSDEQGSVVREANPPAR